MHNDILKTTIDLMKIPSVSGNETEIKNVLQYCKDFFKGTKANIKEFNYKDASPVLLISNKDTNDFDVIMLGHLDVVPAEDKLFNPRIEGNKLYGRGSSDMKSQIAIALHNLYYIISNEFPINVGLLITTDEETTSNGVKNFVKNEDIKSKIIIDNDAGDLTTIVEKYKHSVGVKIKANGLAGHSSRPWNGVNAITELMKTINHIEKYFPQFSKGSKSPKDTWVDTMAVTAFNSPTTMNVIPNTAEALINFRLTDKMSLKRLNEILKEACDLNSSEYEVIMASCGCYMDANHEIIKKYRKIAENIIGEKIEISHMNGATDSRMFADNSVIIMHSVNGDNHHNENEYVEIDSIEKLMEIQREFIENLF